MHRSSRMNILEPLKSKIQTLNAILVVKWLIPVTKVIHSYIT